MSIDEILSIKTTLNIEQQSLENVVQEFAESVRRQVKNASFQIRIEGQDLQLEGITRNQQIRGVRWKNRTVREILTALVIRANPRPVERPTLGDQQLVWVKDTGEPACILITTRSAARQKGYVLPDEFVVGSVP